MYSEADPSGIYDLLEVLGEGSYGVVYKALNKNDRKVYAVKVVPCDGDISEVEKEIHILRECRSPHIVNYFGSYRKDTELWIVLEYCGGGSISDLMTLSDAVLTEAQISSVCSSVLKGLEYLHGMKKIHRDIKAGNILLTDAGNVKIADFGVTAQLNNTISKRQTVIGTPYWMAPEVIQESSYDGEADIWSLGITAIEMAESKPPLAGVHPMRAIFMIPSRPPPTLTSPEKWSAEFNHFVSKCLMRNPEERPRAKDLLKHPFIRKAKSSIILTDLIDLANERLAAAGGNRAKLLGFGPSDKNDDTVKRAKNDDDDDDDEEAEREDDDEGGDGYSTTVFHNTGTMIAKGGDNGEAPAFMKGKLAAAPQEEEEEGNEEYDASTMVFKGTIKQAPASSGIPSSSSSSSPAVPAPAQAAAEDEDEDDGDYSYGTVVIHSDKQNAAVVPSPKSDGSSSSGSSPNPVAPRPSHAWGGVTPEDPEVAGLLPLFVGLSSERLRRELSSLESDMEAEIARLKHDFSKRKGAIDFLLSRQ